MKSARILAVVLCLCVGAIASQPQRSSYDPAGGQRQRQQGGFIDFVLKQINPADKDYGQAMEDVRRTAIEQSIQNVYFWATATSLSLLAFFAVLLIRDDLERKRREMIAARFLAWYHNELIDARTIAGEAIAKNHRMKQAIDRMGEANSGTNSQTSASTPVIHSGPTDVPAVAPAELVTENTSLRQKIAAMQDVEKNLRQQVVQVGRRLQEEKQKNRALKGE